MGNYISKDKLEERITTDRLDKLCKVTGTEQTALLESVTARAEAVIDAFASTRYQTPLPVNELTEEWALSIAEYELYKRGPGGAVPDKIRNSYDDAMSLLKDLSNGKISIPDALSPLAADSDGSSFMCRSNESFFNGQSMNGF